MSPSVQSHPVQVHYRRGLQHRPMKCREGPCSGNLDLQVHRHLRKSQHTEHRFRRSHTVDRRTTPIRFHWNIKTSHSGDLCRPRSGGIYHNLRAYLVQFVVDPIQDSDTFHTVIFHDNTYHLVVGTNLGTSHLSVVRLSNAETKRVKPRIVRAEYKLNILCEQRFFLPYFLRSKNSYSSPISSATFIHSCANSTYSSLVQIQYESVGSMT